MLCLFFKIYMTTIRATKKTTPPTDTPTIRPMFVEELEFDWAGWGQEFMVEQSGVMMLFWFTIWVLTLNTVKLGNEALCKIEATALAFWVELFPVET